MMSDRNDLAYWFPILSSVPGIRVPRTEVVTTDVDLTLLLDGETPDGLDAFLAELGDAAKRLGFPKNDVFLRSGHTSGKHDWRQTCHLDFTQDLASHVYAIVEFSAMADLFGLPTRTWAVREFLNLEFYFTAFDGMPVAREYRCFFRDGEHICTHPYWPIASIRSPSADDWMDRLAFVSSLGSTTVATLRRVVRKVAPHFDGAWSLDVAFTADGEPVCIDMAEMDRSFHWEGCPNGKEATNA